MAAVNIAGVWKYYGKTAAVKDLNLDCGNGEFLAILGPSGCGKSSTLRMLAGLEHISAATSASAGSGSTTCRPRTATSPWCSRTTRSTRTRPCSRTWPIRCGCAGSTARPSSARWPRPRSCWRSMASWIVSRSSCRGAEAAHGDRPRHCPRAQAVPVRRADRAPGCQAARTCAASSRSCSASCTTMVYVTHDQLEALSMADRIAVMHDGVLQQFGTYREIYDHPVNEWVAGFVGEPDELPRLRAGGAGRSAARCPSGVRRADDARAALGPAGRSGHADGRLAMRPAEIAIVPPGVDGAVKANILVTEPLGGDMLVDCALGDSKVLVKTKPDYAGVRGESAGSPSTPRGGICSRPTRAWPTLS